MESSDLTMEVCVGWYLSSGNPRTHEYLSTLVVVKGPKGIATFDGGQDLEHIVHLVTAHPNSLNWGDPESEHGKQFEVETVGRIPVPMNGVKRAMVGH